MKPAVTSCSPVQPGEDKEHRVEVARNLNEQSIAKAGHVEAMWAHVGWLLRVLVNVPEAKKGTPGTILRLDFW